MGNERSKGKRILNYLIVISSFVAALLIIAIAVDSFILPATIHDADTVHVPNLTGQPLDSARYRLLSKNLGYEMNRAQYSEDFPPNVVVNQDPKPGTVVKEGRTVYITQSKGSEKIAVPFVEGMPLRSARVALLREGLQLGDVVYMYDDSVGVDTVITQKTKSGEFIAFGENVDLVISKGPANIVQVPNLIGTTLSDAIEILAESGLEIGKIVPLKSETFQANTIIEQAPPPGEVVQMKTPIIITVTK